ncbi:RNA polymerase sigma factor SigI [Mycobacterium shigaense]|uniref:Putative alternative RNA polymerase SigI n=1 Tax=Mycobacterium shigaense TaxID=722731 RepID=A0A1Z4EPV0_9MYCO|nr:RNA polymerase sigma factor SigI [Mycobacterium shigaense]MEA1121552.1 RNA polymerase sigma factor SigI [Mycobacterium shigaense]PRI15165.1 RNA polymerase subunit sigma [Mycobacterium shigaense]BAX95033.1 putative alternative RNA polymerase SigI [Mycobacterium shigaense]
MKQAQPPSDQVVDAWRRHRPYLVNLGYQILGDIGDAEDVAQEAFLRLSRVAAGDIDDVRGWLTVVTTRLCLDQVRSARIRHERLSPPGHEEHDIPVAQSPTSNPADRVTLDDEVRSALMEVLQRLSPGERVAFVLHDVFGVPFDAIAETVGRPVGTCRQLARRARSKFTTAQPNLGKVTPAEHQLVTEKFITACANGDIAALTAVLDPTVWGSGTVIAEPAPPPQINHGPTAVAANLMRYLGPDVTLVSGPAGQPVVLAFAERRLFAAIVLTIRGRFVTKIEAIADPAARAARA